MYIILKIFWRKHFWNDRIRTSRNTFFHKNKKTTGKNYQSNFSRTLEIKGLKQSVVGQLPSRGWLFVTPWTAAHLASLSFTVSWSLLKFMSIGLAMLSNHRSSLRSTYSRKMAGSWKTQWAFWHFNLTFSSLSPQPPQPWKPTASQVW